MARDFPEVEWQSVKRVHYQLRGDMFIKQPALAKAAMKLAPVEPQPTNLALAQVFNTDTFRNGSQDERRRLMAESSRFRYEYEHQLPFGRHFDVDIDQYIRDKVMLDLGCFTGGRTVAWHEKYGARQSFGVDIDPIFIEASRNWAAERNANCEFRLGQGEKLPFDASSIDVVVSFDVFEHVRSVATTLQEVFRVLRPGGVLIAVFPPFFCPTEHHLSGVSRTPMLQWFFSGDALYQAYREIIAARNGSSWYLPHADRLAKWERLYTLNGVTVGSFKRTLSHLPWSVEYLRFPPWPSTTRRFYGNPLLKVLWRPLEVLTKLPYVRELVTDRVCVIVRKPATSGDEVGSHD